MAAAALQGAVKAALFKSPVARTAALSAVQGAVSQRVSALTTPASERIAWDAYNFPHANIGLLHLDLAELLAKRPAQHALVRLLYWWWAAVLVALTLNLVDNLVLVSIVRGAAYSNLAPFFSVLSLLSLGSAAFSVLYTWYHGVCEASGRSKTIARALLCLLCFFWLLYALMPSGNVLGLAGFAQGARHEHALSDGTPAAAVAFWLAATAIESLCFAALCGSSCYLAYRLLTHAS